MFSFDFEDLQPGDQLTDFFLNNSPFNIWNNRGGSVFGTGFQWSDGTIVNDGRATVVPPGTHGGSASQSVSVNNLCLVYTAPDLVAMKQLSFDFADYGGNLNISVNGHAMNIGRMMDIHGQFLGQAKATVDVTGSNISGYWGVVTLDGEIAPKFMFGHLVVGGQEFLLDNITATPA